MPLCDEFQDATQSRHPSYSRRVQFLQTAYKKRVASHGTKLEKGPPNQSLLETVLTRIPFNEAQLLFL